MLETENGRREAVVQGSWGVRRQALLAVLTAVPMLLMAYALAVSIITPGGVLDDRVPLLSSAVLIGSVGGYVFWKSLSSLARARAAARGAGRIPQRTGRYV